MSGRVERLRMDDGMVDFIRKTQNRTTKKDSEWVAVSDILRVIDEEIMDLRSEQGSLVRSKWENQSTWNRLQAQIDALRALRARFEEAES